jgi:acetyltransferase-like isoleucine patch superfamily enzyme
MRTAYILKTDTRIHPFGDPAGAAWVGGRTLTTLQEEELSLAGIRAVHVNSPADLPATGPYFVLPDRLFVSARCAGVFAAMAEDSGENAVLCMPRSPVTEYVRPLSSARDVSLPAAREAVAYDLFHVGGRLPAPAGGRPGANGILEALAVGSAKMLVRPSFTVDRLRHPNVGRRPYVTQIPVSDTIVAHVESWVHVLWLNHVLTGLVVRRALAEVPGPIESLRRAAVSANIPGCVVNSVVGGTLDAHPTARIENSVVGSGARVGARALVKDCILGDDVVVGDGTKFIGCVVGDRCNSLSDSLFVRSTFYPDATLSNLFMRECVIGRFAFLTTAVLCFADSHEGPVRVFHNGEMRSTGRHVLGACMGHETTLGTRAIFLPGLALPNGCIIVMPPGEGVHKVPATGDPATPLVWDAGALRPVRDVFPGYTPADAGAGGDRDRDVRAGNHPGEGDSE